MDRWVTAGSYDDDIDSPMFGSGEKIDSTIIAKGDDSWRHRYGRPSNPNLGVFNSNKLLLDGKKVSEGEEIAHLSGCSETILLMERIHLNILGHLSVLQLETKKWSSKAAKQVSMYKKTTWVYSTSGLFTWVEDLSIV